MASEGKAEYVTLLSLSIKRNDGSTRLCLPHNVTNPRKRHEVRDQVS